MGNFKTEYFIAKKLSSTGESRGVMQRIATLTVAVGLCVMILAIAVINGFKHEIFAKLEILGSDIKIVALDAHNSVDSSPIYRETNIEKAISNIDKVDFIAPYTTKTGVLKGNNTIQGVMLKGLNQDYDFTSINELLIEGEIPRISDSTRYKDILISKSLASKMQVKLGDRIEIIFADNQSDITKDKYAIKGIYHSDMELIDDHLLITDMRNIQKVNNWLGNQISGYEIKSKGKLNLASFSDKVVNAIFEQGTTQGLMILDIKDSYPMIFDWLSAHNVNGAVIIGIMLIVAIFNMISALLIILLERTSMIGTLKALGMRDSALSRLFLLRSAKIVAWGMLWGNILGISISLIQKYTHIITLDAGGYFLSAVPISLSWTSLLGLNALCFVVISIAMFLPTRIILHIKPEITLRYK